MRRAIVNANLKLIIDTESGNSDRIGVQVAKKSKSYCGRGLITTAESTEVSKRPKDNPEANCSTPKILFYYVKRDQIS